MCASHIQHETNILKKSRRQKGSVAPSVFVSVQMTVRMSEVADPRSQTYSIIERPR